jgi:hypothetical protein
LISVVARGAPILSLVAALALAASTPQETRAQGSAFPRFTTRTIGESVSCGLLADGTAYCWGANHYGQLALPADSTRQRCDVDFSVTGPCSRLPMRISGDLRFARISAGDDHACGITTAGDAYCWGLNMGDQLGARTTETCPIPERAQYPNYHPESCSRVPLRVDAQLKFSDIVAGYSTSCAITTEQRLYCWGGGSVSPYGECCYGATAPIPVATGERFVSLAAGYDVCALSAAGQVVCIDLVRGKVDSLERVVTNQKFVSFGSGSSHLCALTGDGVAWCWGSNKSGELGIGSVSEFRKYESPVRVVSSKRFQSIGGGFDSTCGLTIDGDVYCWGLSSVTGDSATNRCHHTDYYAPCALTPRHVLVGLKATTLVVGHDGACIADDRGEPHCWGSGLGSGSPTRGETKTLDAPVEEAGARPIIRENWWPLLLGLTPLLLGIGVVFTGSRRTAVEDLSSGGLARLWLLTLLALVATVVLFATAEKAESRFAGFAMAGLSVCVVEGAGLMALVTAYWIAAKVFARFRRAS